jgi:agmatine/peptidylarginine deiminase
MKHLLLSFLLSILAGLTVVAQDTLNLKPLLRHEMTPEEALLKDQIGRGFVETDPPAGPVRDIAEFDRMQGALVRYPFGIPITLIKEMAEDVMVTTIVANTSQKNTVINQYVSNGVDTSHCNFLIAPSDSYWTRDYGPWYMTDSSHHVGIIDFPYNRPRPNDDEIPKKMAEMLGIPWYGMNVIHTGGNYMEDGHGVGSSTDLVWDENPTQTAAQINQKMLDYLGIENYQVVPDPNISSSIDHIDCWSKFLAPDKILIRQALPTDPEYSALESAATYWAGQISSYGYPYRVFRVKTPSDQPYSNSVILNNKVLVPFMNSAWDDSAKAAYEAAMPGYEVIGFIANPSTPWLSTDALHCRVRGVADIGLLYLDHLPLYGTQPCEQDYILNAGVFASSQQPVTGDSVMVHYRVNGGMFESKVMSPLPENRYTVSIPRQPAGTVVEYYLSAADASGRSETMPLIGAADPFRFTTVHTTLAPVPDTLWFLTPSDCIEGKITQLTSFLASAVALNSIQMEGAWAPWYVDSISATLPAMVNPGDSVAVRVKMYIPVGYLPGGGMIIDTLVYNTSTGSNHVIIMINPDLLSSVPGETENELRASLYPNPAVGEVTLRVELRTSQRTVVEITGMDGRVVARPWKGRMVKGTTAIVWDGRSSDGRQLPAGVYLCRISAGDEMTSLRLMLVR